jgi:hypothetical protein
MKYVVILISLIIGFSSIAQGTAGIYKVKWFIDKRITNSQVITNLNGGGNFGLDNLSIPQNLVDSVINEIQIITTNELHANARVIYPLSKKGNELRTSPSQDYVGGLPRGSRRKAMRTENMEYYVKFKIYLGLFKTFTFGNELASYSRLKPYVTVKMKAYGVDRRRKFSKRTRLSGFNNIGSLEFQVGGIKVTNSNALPINEVVDMIFQGLDKFKNKAK